MDWDVVMGGGPECVTRTGNGGHAPSFIDPLNQEALDALYDDQQRQMAYDHRPSCKPLRSPFAQGFVLSISTALHMQHIGKWPVT